MRACGRSFRCAALALAALSAAPAGASVWDVRLTMLRGDLYAVEGQDVVLHLPRCVRPVVGAGARFDSRMRAIWFEGSREACAVHRMLRAVAPASGFYDLLLTSDAPDLYDAGPDGWLIETEGCAVEAARTPTRVVIDPRGPRLLLTAPEHPDASITGRVTCKAVRFYTELEF